MAAQQYLPEDLQGQVDYYRPTDRGFEARLGPRWSWLRQRIRPHGPGSDPAAPSSERTSGEEPVG